MHWLKLFTTAGFYSNYSLTYSKYLLATKLSRLTVCILPSELMKQSWMIHYAYQGASGQKFKIKMFYTSAEPGEIYSFMSHCIFISTVCQRACLRNPCVKRVTVHMTLSITLCRQHAQTFTCKYERKSYLSWHKRMCEVH